MWICKFRVYDEKSELRKLVEKFKVDFYYQPINYWVRDNKYFFVVAGVLRGTKKNKNRFFLGLKKLKEPRRTEVLERENDFFMLITSHHVTEEEKKQVAVFYNPVIIHHKPIKFNSDGWEEWEISSVDRKSIEKIITTARNIYELKLSRFYKAKVKNFGFVSIMPQLTDKQEQALNLALKQGYYSFPRKISLDKLSGVAQVSFLTLRAHIRKAENKIISFALKINK